MNERARTSGTHICTGLNPWARRRSRCSRTLSREEREVDSMAFSGKVTCNLLDYVGRCKNGIRFRRTSGLQQALPYVIKPTKVKPLRAGPVRLGRAVLPGLEVRHQQPLDVIFKRLTDAQDCLQDVASGTGRWLALVGGTGNLVQAARTQHRGHAAHVRRVARGSEGSRYSRDQGGDGKKTRRARPNSRFPCCNFRCECRDRSREDDCDPSPDVPGIWQ
jgi:hypothetical protein